MIEERTKELEDTCAYRWRRIEKVETDVAKLRLLAQDLLEYARDAKVYYQKDNRSWDLEYVTKTIGNAEYLLNRMKSEYDE